MWLKPLVFILFLEASLVILAVFVSKNLKVHLNQNNMHKIQYYNQ